MVIRNVFHEIQTNYSQKLHRQAFVFLKNCFGLENLEQLLKMFIKKYFIVITLALEFVSGLRQYTKSDILKLR